VILWIDPRGDILGDDLNVCSGITSREFKAHRHRASEVGVVRHELYRPAHQSAGFERCETRIDLVTAVRSLALSGMSLKVECHLETLSDPRFEVFNFPHRAIRRQPLCNRSAIRQGCIYVCCIRADKYRCLIRSMVLASHPYFPFQVAKSRNLQSCKQAYVAASSEATTAASSASTGACWPPIIRIYPTSYPCSRQCVQSCYGCVYGLGRGM